jgi:two-component system OmpR family sensor kinase
MLPTLPAAWIDQVAAGTAPAQQVLLDPSGIRRLVVVLPFRLPATDAAPSPVMLLVQAASLAAADAVLNQLRLYLILGVIGGTLIGILVGLALTRVVLKPLARMAGTAGAISAGDLSRRLHLPLGNNEIARLGASFDDMVDRLVAMMEAQRRFIADASHEMRTPLTSLEGLAEMLLTGADRGNAQVAQRMERSMHSELRRLSHLVADLLTLSRLDSAPALIRTQVDVGNVLAQIAEQMTPQAEARQVRLTVQRSEPAIALADPDQLKQVMLNLVDNAIRYTPPDGEVRLTCTLDTSRGNVRLDVQDSGPGILPADIPHIFDRFYRGDLSRSRSSGSSGLGLAIARSIVQAHGGTISVRSTPGAGTCFTVVLPTQLAFHE